MSSKRLHIVLPRIFDRVFISVFIAVAILICLATASELRAQQTTKGREFFVSFLPNIHNFGPASDDSLYIYVVADVPTAGTIQFSNGSVPQSRSFSITNPAVIYQFAIQWSGYELRGYNQSVAFDVNNDNERPISRSFRITTSEPVAVYAMNQAVTTSDAAMLYPVPALGTEYVILSYKADGVTDNTGPTLSYTPSEFCVVATEDNTIVNVIPSAPSHASGLATKSFTLQRGQAWLSQTAFSTSQLNYDFSGTRVLSSAPVAVFSGHQRALVPVEQRGVIQSRDQLFEQLPPVSVWGKSYILTPLAAPPGTTDVQGATDLFRVVAAEDNTTVRFNNTVIATLNRGQVHEAPLTAAGLLTASAKVCVALYKRSHSVGQVLQNGDPFMLIVPPRAQYLKQYRFTNCQAGGDYVSQFITVTTAQSNASGITLDGQPLNATWRAVPNTCYVYAHVPMTDGAHTLSSPKLIGLFVYGYGPAISYGYVGGMAFVPDVQDDAVSAGPDQNICVGDTAIISLRGKAASFSWSGLRNGIRPPCDTCASFRFVPSQSTVFILNAIDSLGCSILDSVVINVLQIPTVDAMPDTVICTDAPFVLRAEGQFIDAQWSPPVGLSCSTCPVTTVTPTKDITYTVVVRNGASPRCSATDTVRIRYAKGFAGAFPKPITVCRGDSVPISVPYTGSVRWTPTAGLSCSTCTNVIIKPQRSMRYTITGDSAACWSQATLDIVVADPPTLRAPADTIVCKGTPLYINLQTNAANLQWQPTTFLPGASLRVLTITPDSSIQYIIRAQSAAGCVVSDTFAVTVQPVPTINTMFTDTTVCEGTPVLIETNVVDADTIEWTPITGLSCTTCSSPRVVAQSNQTYTVRARTKSGCERSATVTIQTRPSPIITCSADTVRVCRGERAVISARSSSGSVRWDTSQGVSCSDCDTTSIAPLRSGFIIVSSSNSIGCVARDSIWIEVLPTPLPVVTVDNDTLCETYGVANVNVQGSVASETYSWSPPDGLSCTNCPNPTARPNKTTVYQVTLRSPQGCSATAAVPITVVPCARRLRVETVDAGSLVACDSRDTVIEVLNAGETDIRFDSLSVLQSNGLRVDVNDEALRDTILVPNAVLFVPVRLQPQRSGDVFAVLGTHTKAGENGSDTTHSSVVGVQAQTRDVTVSLLPASVNEGGVFQLPVQLRSTTWTDVPLRAIGFRLRYDKTWMNFTDTVTLSSNRTSEGWSLVSGQEERRGNDAMVVFQLRGGVPLARDEIILLPKFRVLLSSVSSFRPTIDSVWFFDQDLCLRATPADAEVLPFGCIRELRRVSISAQTFALHGVKPQPVHSPSAVIEYSIGFECPVRIEIVDAFGRTESLLRSENHPAGEFAVTFDAHRFAPGLYQCIVYAADRTFTAPILVVR